MTAAVGPAARPEREGNDRAEAQADDPERDDRRERAIDDQHRAERGERARGAEPNDGRLSEPGDESIPDEARRRHPGRERHDAETGHARVGAHRLAEEDGAPFDRDPLHEEGAPGDQAQQEENPGRARAGDVRILRPPGHRFLWRLPSLPATTEGTRCSPGRPPRPRSGGGSRSARRRRSPRRRARRRRTAPRSTCRGSPTSPGVRTDARRRPPRCSSPRRSGPPAAPMPRKSRVSDARSPAVGRSANPTPIAGMPPRTTRRPPHRRISRVRHTGPGEQPHREARQGDPQPGGVQSRLSLDMRDPRPEEPGQHRVRRERGRHPDPRSAQGALILAGGRHRESLCDASRNRHVGPTAVR